LEVRKTLGKLRRYSAVFILASPKQGTSPSLVIDSKMANNGVWRRIVVDVRKIYIALHVKLRIQKFVSLTYILNFTSISVHQHVLL
jgi:hypothetical protein